jgi:hypothetical protein
VRNLHNRDIRAFVILSALTELGGNPPDDFPNSLERRFRINRHGRQIRRNDYDILICPFELRTWGIYGFDRYIRNARREGFNVKVAIIERDYHGDRYDISNIQRICRRFGIRPLRLDIRKDYVEEARWIRRRFYP